MFLIKIYHKIFDLIQSKIYKNKKKIGQIERKKFLNLSEVFFNHFIEDHPCKDSMFDTLKIFNTKKEIKVIPNFIDTTKQNSTIINCQRSLMANDNEMILTHISNFRKVKRINDVIAIFNLVLKKIPAKLVMVGDGPERLNAELIAKKLGINEKIIFLGNSSEIDKILCMSDLFLLPSETESFGLAALEAMAFSVPVISSNTGGIPEVNIHGKSGFLSPVGDVESMANNAIQILSDSNLLENFKSNAKVISNEFDIHKIVPKYEDLYQSVLK